MDKVFLDITKSCNGKCIYCYTDSGIASKSELTTSEIKKLIDDICLIGIPSLSIAGGEPFIRKDILEILNYTKNKIQCSVTTNGTIIRPEILKSIIDNNIKLTVSFDTLNREHFLSVRQGINFDLVLSNIKYLCRNDQIRNLLSLRSVVSIYNLNDILPMVDFCNQMKIPKYKVNIINSFGRAQNELDIIPDFQTFMIKLIEIKEYCTFKNGVTSVSLPIEKYLSQNKRSCTLGKNSMTINQDGLCYPCAFSRDNFVLGDIRRDSLNKIVEKSINFVHENPICNQCEINRYKKYNPIEINS